MDRIKLYIYQQTIVVSPVCHSGLIFHSRKNNKWYNADFGPIDLNERGVGTGASSCENINMQNFVSNSCSSFIFVAEFSILPKAWRELLIWNSEYNILSNNCRLYCRRIIEQIESPSDESIKFMDDCILSDVGLFMIAFGCSLLLRVNIGEIMPALCNRIIKADY